jgi:hypothetical protein
VPLLIRFQQQFRAHPELRTLNFDSLSPRLVKFLKTRTMDLLEMGFGEPTLVQSRSNQTTSAYLILLVHRQAGDKACVSALVARGTTTLSTVYVEFSTRFDTGEVFDTVNSKELSAFPPGPGQVRTQVPMVKDEPQVRAVPSENRACRVVVNPIGHLPTFAGAGILSKSRPHGEWSLPTLTSWTTGGPCHDPRQPCDKVLR